MERLLQTINRDALIRLQFMPGVGLAGRRKVWQFLQTESNVPLTLTNLLDCLALPEIKAKQLANCWRDSRLSDTIARNHQFGKVTTILDEDYPTYLKEMYAAPLVLFSRGNWRLTQQAGLAVVGARQATAYSYTTLKQWLPAVIATKIPIISGLAAGVDALSHQLAVQHNGHTIGIIGTGLDIAYPAANRSLQQTLMRTQLVISEYPLGTGPARHRFPERNRIIAGLAQSVLVTEAAIHSGSLITANVGLQENRNVMAIPGRVTDPLSAGCNALISAGATPVCNVEGILNELQFQS
ncbi:MAG: DNA-processing protein DprA [Furfurilactobacillus sp.]|jgi:DNA processing protein|uniref:DNA-processing protein DprA n=1 Tax=Furfurilactobacillus milii TaxID=2888272 RepID=A0ABT6D743_9LACO|nr:MULTISPECIES: DNA-processing protein DprA [Furfurilactobacillus]QLE66549.1 Rossmann fold nucleotide-binding protein Smf involved in DNA uptake [Furfurilactobacillus rossiae]MCF6160002.1 DNA-processing protein DprA [Furfurilactobacillus milii]MCF6162449.1 DNA-processing protein DprA [Furfurilactobacillus milii]MCF6419969.1 DNA-processing protein DprA [Furfurilactobacillus milii]MCH4010744.1 DNA-processing protein DprA [Furfurilactobacillus sp.]